MTRVRFLTKDSPEFQAHLAMKHTQEIYRALISRNSQEETIDIIYTRWIASF